MATGRIGSTPVLRVRWSDQPTTGTTALSGLDDNSVALVYDAGYEAVYRNGVLLSRGNDYTATDGTTVTLIDATLDGDIIEIFANDLVPLTDAISKGQYNAKGALLSATAASTPAVLPVGTNGQVLTAASGESTGLQWATPGAAATSYALLNTGGTALTGAATITVSGLSGYNKLFVRLDAASSSTAGAEFFWRLNTATSDYASNYIFIGAGTTYSSSNQSAAVETGKIPCAYISGNAASQIRAVLSVDGANSSGVKTYTHIGGASSGGGDNQYHIWGGGTYTDTNVISSISIITAAGNLDNGTIWIYGAN
jgi:hypothetical protein